MSPSKFNQENPDNELEDLEIITLSDEQGRTLDCYIENALEADDLTYLLLVPVDTPVMILAWDEEDESDAILIEDSEEIEEIFGNAKAVLAELNLHLKLTAHTLTVSGELPALDDELVLSLEIESETQSNSEPEELQFLASFSFEDEKYSIYTPLAPLLFLASCDEDGNVELVSPDDQQLQPILEELLFEELE
ncbi:MAG: hypothetical protein N5P05_002499 [Chroococcopsis gigantea SAG 12.99]|jgi:hypothetical protein|nr:hypothetical protein [Chroococcopsis gigantea SAG 12.99]